MVGLIKMNCREVIEKKTNTSSILGNIGNSTHYFKRSTGKKSKAAKFNFPNVEEHLTLAEASPLHFGLLCTELYQ